MKRLKYTSEAGVIVNRRNTSGRHLKKKGTKKQKEEVIKPTEIQENNFKVKEEIKMVQRVTQREDHANLM